MAVIDNTLNPLFVEDWESGGLGAWTNIVVPGAGDIIAIAVDFVHAGAFSLRILDDWNIPLEIGLQHAIQAEIQHIALDYWVYSISQTMFYNTTVRIDDNAGNWMSLGFGIGPQGGSGVRYNGLTLFGAPALGFNVWTNIRMEVDMASGRVWMWVNGIFINQGVGCFMSNLTTISIREWAQIVASTDTRFDDVQLLGTGDILWNRRRRGLF